MENLKRSSGKEQFTTILAVASVLFEIIATFFYGKCGVFYSWLNLLDLAIWAVYLFALKEKENFSILPLALVAWSALKTFLAIILNFYGISKSDDMEMSVPWASIVICILLILTTFMITKKNPFSYIPFVILCGYYVVKLISLVLIFVSTDLPSSYEIWKWNLLGNITNYAAYLTCYLSMALFFKHNITKLTVKLKPKDEALDTQNLLLRLKAQLDSGEITEEEYDERRSKILETL